MVPDPIFVGIATALAEKATGAVYDVVRKKFEGRHDSLRRLEAVKGATPASHEVILLGEELANVARSDSQFESDLRSAWDTSRRSTGSDAVINEITGTVSGKVVQARDIDGGVKF